jgi:hypothetical protein
MFNKKDTVWYGKSVHKRVDWYQRRIYREKSQSGKKAMQKRGDRSKRRIYCEKGQLEDEDIQPWLNTIEHFLRCIVAILKGKEINVRHPIFFILLELIEHCLSGCSFFLHIFDYELRPKSQQLQFRAALNANKVKNWGKKGNREYCLKLSMRHTGWELLWLTCPKEMPHNLSEGLITYAKKDQNCPVVGGKAAWKG